MSGKYGTGEVVPDGVIADAFYAKGYGNPAVLLSILPEMIRAPRAHENPAQSIPLIN
jgi:hypothetical protein